MRIHFSPLGISSPIRRPAQEGRRDVLRVGSDQWPHKISLLAAFLIGQSNLSLGALGTSLRVWLHRRTHRQRHHRLDILLQDREIEGFELLVHR
jgi:hypothetical protein